MKKIFVLVCAALMAVGLTGCKKDEIKSGDLIGEWHLTDETVDGSEVNTASLFQVYVTFYADKHFSLKQKSSDEMRFTYHTGTYKLSGKTLSGEYQDGTPWGGSYKVSFENGGEVMKMRYSKNGISGVQTWQYIGDTTDDSPAGQETKSSAREVVFLL